MNTFQLEIEFDSEAVWQDLERSEAARYVGIDGNGTGIKIWPCQDKDMMSLSSRHPEAVFKVIIESGKRNPILKFYQAGKRIPNPNGREKC